MWMQQEKIWSKITCKVIKKMIKFNMDWYIQTIIIINLKKKSEINLINF